MAFIPSPHGASARLVWTAGLREWSNILWFTKTNFTQTDMEVLAAALKAAFDSNAQSVISMTASLDRVEITDGRTEGAQIVQSTGTPVGGGASADMMPISTAFVITSRTGLRGRSYRGRIYFSGMPEGSHTNDEWNEDTATRLLGFAGGLKTAGANNEWTMVVRSTQHNNQVLSTAVMTPVNTFSARSKILAHQRRRVVRP